jgi:hypothetical protein
MPQQPVVGQGLHVVKGLWLHPDTPHSLILVGNQYDAQFLL